VPRAKLPAASEPTLAALTEPLRMVLCCRMASTFDPQLPNANGSNPELKLRSASSQILHWRTAAATIKSALVRAS